MHRALPHGSCIGRAPCSLSIDGAGEQGQTNEDG